MVFSCAKAVPSRASVKSVRCLGHAMFDVCYRKEFDGVWVRPAGEAMLDVYGEISMKVLKE